MFWFYLVFTFVNMKKGTGLLVVAVGAAAYFILTGAQNVAAALRVRFGRLSFNFDETRRALFIRLYFNVTLNIINPTDRNINLNGVGVRMSYNGSPVGVALRETPFTVQRFGNTDVTLLVGVSTLGIFKTIQDATTAIFNKKPMAFDVEGRVTGAGNIVIPIKEKIEFSL